ncbi:MAG: hypothetical protein ABI478_04020 [Propionivibrio sp.]
MKPDRLLYLSAHQLAAFHAQAGRLTSEGVFPATEGGHQAFVAYLERHASSVFALLANVAEEGFHVETIPFLRGGDRQAVIRRKLEQLFFNARLSTSHSLGFRKTRRKDERILLAALTNSEFFAPWLAAFRRTEVALAGVYSLPVLAPALLRKLKLTEPHCLLLTVQDQSLRQSYFENGELHFSRLTPLHLSSIAGIAQSFAAETAKLQQYLASQRIIGRSQAITAHILVHPDAQKVVADRCVDTATVHFNFLDLEHCAALIGLKPPPTDSHADALFLQLLATAPPAIQFADDEQRHGYHLRQIRFALHAVGAIALAGCLLLAGKLMFDSYTLVQEREALASESLQARQRYDAIVRTLPAIPTSRETLIQVVNRYVALENASSTPEGLFHEISRALAAAPAAELERIDWKVGGADGDPRIAEMATAGATPLTIPGDSEAALVQGMLTLSGNTSARAVLAAFDTLVAALLANPKLQVEVLQRPVDIDSGKSLRGGDLAAADNQQRAFSLRIVRKLAS